MRCRSTRRPRSSSTTPNTPPICSRCRRSATSTAACRTPRTPHSRSAWPPLEGALGALAASSGSSAQLVALLALATAGDHVVASNALYGGTFTQFDVTLRRLGIDVTFVDLAKPDEVAAAIRPRRRRSTPRRSATQAAACSTSRLRRARARARHSARRRQHFRHAVPLPAHRVGRRHRHPFGHQVHRRPRRRARRRTRRVGPLPLRQRQVPCSHRTLARLPRPQLLGELPRVRLPDARPHRGHARRRRRPFTVPLVPAPPRSRDPVAPHATSRRERRNIVARFLSDHPKVAWVRVPDLR